MTKRQAPVDGSVATRFEPGQSGNSKGRPRKPKPPPSLPFAVLDELLTVNELESVGELPLEDAVLLKTYQRAIAGGVRAGKKIVKMILEREKLRSKRRALASHQITKKVEEVDPENALEALEVLGIASRRADANVDDSWGKRLRLERWAVEAALKRRHFGDLSNADKSLIRGWTHDGRSVNWPTTSTDHD